MKTWTLKFASYKHPDDILETIENRSKTLETRPYTPHETKDYSMIASGDKLVFKSLDTGREVVRYALGTRVYKSVSDMLEHEDYSKIFPGVESKEKLNAIYEEVKKKWGQEYKDNLEKNGIVVIYIDQQN